MCSLLGSWGSSTWYILSISWWRVIEVFPPVGIAALDKCIWRIPSKEATHFVHNNMAYVFGTSITTTSMVREIFRWASNLIDRSWIRPQTFISLDSMAHTLLYGHVVFKSSWFMTFRDMTFDEFPKSNFPPWDPQ